MQFCVSFLLVRSFIVHYAYMYHCCWVPLRPSDSDFSQIWKPWTGESPLLFLNDHKEPFGSMHCSQFTKTRHSKKLVKLHWWTVTCGEKILEYDQESVLYSLWNLKKIESRPVNLFQAQQLVHVFPLDTKLVDGCKYLRYVHIHIWFC
jgi:hypothetical protein